MADALGTPGPPAGPGVVSALDHRLDQAGLYCLGGATALSNRLGVMAGPGSTSIVTGTAATGTMTVSIAPHHWITSRGTADGIYAGTLEAATTANIAAAPGSNSRIDVVYVKQNDQYSPVSPDGSSAPVYGVQTGTAAVSPTKPAIPVGAVELATVTVATGATSTNGAGVTIVNTARQVVARGGITPVRDQADRDTITAYPAIVQRLDTSDVEVHGLTGSWGSITKDKPWVDQVRSTSYSHLMGAGSAMNTIASGSFSVTVPSGRTLDVEFKAPRLTLAASADTRLQLLVDGVVEEYQQHSLGPSMSAYTPIRLTGRCVGTGASVTVAVQGATPGPTSTIDGGAAGTGGPGPVILRYRIW